jgi:hypothetical protein
MPRQPRPNSDVIFGPSMNGAGGLNWDALLSDIEDAVPNGPLTYGMNKEHEGYDFKIDQLWRTWQESANVEIRAAFGIDVKHKLGGSFDIKEGPLHEAIASKLCHRASSLSAHKWALRTVCEARAKNMKQCGPGFVTGKILDKRYSQLAKFCDDGFLPNGIGIAIDLQLFWSGGGNSQLGSFDAWHEMLSEQVRLLEASTRKDSYKCYRETLEGDVRKGTARAFRLLRPLVAPPSGKVRVGGQWVYSPVEVLSEHRATWAKWWQEGTDPQPIYIGLVPLGAIMSPALLRGGGGQFQKMHLVP